jgi:hypothetical protein
LRFPNSLQILGLNQHEESSIIGGFSIIFLAIWGKIS